MRLWIIISVLLINLFGAEANIKKIAELVNNLKENEFTMRYYFWVTGSSSFLSSKKEDNSYSLWNFNSNREWVPVHNVGKTSKIFSSVKFVDGEIIIGTKLAKANSEHMDKLQDKKFTVQYYFWVANSSAFLINKSKEDKISIWHFTADKKWMPVHNSKEFDGFGGIGHTLLNIEFNEKTGMLKTGVLSPKIQVCLDTDICM